MATKAVETQLYKDVAESCRHLLLSDKPVVAGDALEWTILFIAGPAGSYTLVDTVPDGAANFAWSDNQGSAGTGAINQTYVLAAGDMVEITITAIVATGLCDPCTITNTVTVTEGCDRWEAIAESFIVGDPRKLKFAPGYDGRHQLDAERAIHGLLTDSPAVLARLLDWLNKGETLETYVARYGGGGGGGGGADVFANGLSVVGGNLVVGLSNGSSIQTALPPGATLVQDSATQWTFTDSAGVATIITDSAGGGAGDGFFSPGTPVLAPQADGSIVVTQNFTTELGALVPVVYTIPAPSPHLVAYWRCDPLNNDTEVLVEYEWGPTGPTGTITYWSGTPLAVYTPANPNALIRCTDPQQVRWLGVNPVLTAPANTPQDPTLAAVAGFTDANGNTRIAAWDPILGAWLTSNSDVLEAVGAGDVALPPGTLGFDQTLAAYRHTAVDGTQQKLNGPNVYGVVRDDVNGGNGNGSSTSYDNAEFGGIVAGDPSQSAPGTTYLSNDPVAIAQSTSANAVLNPGDSLLGADLTIEYPSLSEERLHRNTFDVTFYAQAWDRLTSGQQVIWEAILLQFVGFGYAPITPAIYLTTNNANGTGDIDIDFASAHRVSIFHNVVPVAPPGLVGFIPIRVQVTYSAKNNGTLAAAPTPNAAADGRAGIQTGILWAGSVQLVDENF